MQEREEFAQLGDDEVMELAKENPAAFASLYERFVGRIFNYVYYRVGNRVDAEDLTARTFQRALTGVRRFQNRGVPVSAWFYRIAHNLVANHHRDRSRRRTISLDVLAGQRAEGDSPGTVAERNERAEALRRVVMQLPEERQQLLLLKFNEHLSNAEIGEIMGKTENAVKSLYHRTLLSLRQILRDDGLWRGTED